MKNPNRSSLVLGLVAGTALTAAVAAMMGQGAAQGAPAATQPAAKESTPQQRQLAAAQQWHELQKQQVKLGEATADLEQRFVWSKRLMESEIGVAPGAEARAKAAAAHRDRMRGLEIEAEASHNSGALSALQLAAARYYRAEAEASLPATPDAHGHDHDHGKPAAVGAGGDHGDHGHGEGGAIGTATIGAWTVTVSGEVKAGAEAHLDIKLSGSTARPAAVRVWIGSQDGKGAMKQKADGDGKEYHAHTDVPNPIPADAKLWVEIDDGKGGKSVGGFTIKR